MTLKFTEEEIPQSQFKQWFLEMDESSHITGNLEFQQNAMSHAFASHRANIE